MSPLGHLSTGRFHSSRYSGHGAIEQTAQSRNVGKNGQVIANTGSREGRGRSTAQAPPTRNPCGTGISRLFHPAGIVDDVLGRERGGFPESPLHRRSPAVPRPSAARSRAVSSRIRAWLAWRRATIRPWSPPHAKVEKSLLPSNTSLLQRYYIRTHSLAKNSLGVATIERPSLRPRGRLEWFSGNAISSMSGRTPGRSRRSHASRLLPEGARVAESQGDGQAEVLGGEVEIEAADGLGPLPDGRPAVSDERGLRGLLHRQRRQVAGRAILPQGLALGVEQVCVVGRSGAPQEPGGLPEGLGQSLARPGILGRGRAEGGQDLDGPSEDRQGPRIEPLIGQRTCLPPSGTYPEAPERPNRPPEASGPRTATASANDRSAPAGSPPCRSTSASIASCSASCAVRSRSPGMGGQESPADLDRPAIMRQALIDAARGRRTAPPGSGGYRSHTPCTRSDSGESATACSCSRRARLQRRQRPTVVPELVVEVPQDVQGPAQLGAVTRLIGLGSDQPARRSRSTSGWRRMPPRSGRPCDETGRSPRGSPPASRGSRSPRGAPRPAPTGTRAPSRRSPGPCPCSCLDRMAAML